MDQIEVNAEIVISVHIAQRLPSRKGICVKAKTTIATSASDEYVVRAEGRVLVAVIVACMEWAAQDSNL